MEDYPKWVSDWNGQRQAEQLAGTEWSLSQPREKYLLANQDDRPYEVDLKGYGRTFPHAFGPPGDPLLFTRILVSAEGDRLLSDFGKTLIEEEGLGQDEVTDYLSISFSGVDAVNHFFGPSSLENEEVVVRLDRTLADLLDFVDKRVGLDQTILVLSADHGMAEMPEYATELGYQAGRLYGDEVLEMARATSKRLFRSEELVSDFFRPYLYLDKEALARMGMERRMVAEGLAAELVGLPGIGGAVTAAQAREAAPRSAAAAVKHNHHPRRSGDLYIYPEPYWFMFDRGAVAAMHGSPWRYDSHVPVVFAGPGILPSQVSRLVHPIDVAPTLSALLGLSPPAAAQGIALPEVVD
jgi:hypothetical protein